MTVITDPVLRRARSEVSDSAVESDVRVAEARRAVADVQKRHRRETDKVAAFDKVVARAAEMATLAQAKLDRLTEQLPGLAARVVLGQTTESDEDAHYEEMARTRRVMERWALAKPLLEDQRRSVRSPVGALARELEDRLMELDEIRDEVRTEIAQATL